MEKEMKVTMPNYWKTTFTVYEAEQARKVIKAMRDDELTAKQYAQVMARAFLRDDAWEVVEVLKASAEVVKSPTIEWDSICADSGYMDVRITATFELITGFLVLCGDITDIWKADGETDISSDFSGTFYEVARIK